MENNSTQENSILKSKDSEIFTSCQVKADKSKPIKKDVIEVKVCCAVHSEYPPFYVCTVCKNIFCKLCPTTTDGKLKFCPFCGGSCVLYSGLNWKKNNQQADYEGYDEEIVENNKKVKKVRKSLELIDFMAAVTYPFYYPVSFVIGSILLFLMIIGQIAALFAGGWMLYGTFAFILISIMLKFGILMKTKENFSNADFKNSFLPRLQKSSITKNFINPLISGICIYIVTFGIFAILAISVVFYAGFTNDETVEPGTGVTKSTGVTNDPNETSKKFENKFNEIREVELKKIINEKRKVQFEKIFGHNHLIESENLEKIINSIVNYSPLIFIPVVTAFIFGFLYFPIACIISIKNRKYTSLFNFKSGIKEIKIFKFDYVKIILMNILFCIILLTAVIGMFSFFDFIEIPVAGIPITLFAESALLIYFWLVFSGILGILVCKNTEKI